MIKFKVWDKINKRWITSENQEELGYYIEISLDGSLDVSHRCVKDPDLATRTYCEDIKDFELHYEINYDADREFKHGRTQTRRYADIGSTTNK